jgi:lipopolysaccharide export system protein LptA
MARCLILGAALWLLAASALAAPAAPVGAGSREPVSVTADRMEADDVAKTLVFIGHAVAKQGDMTLYGDRLTIHSATGGSEVERIVAEGNVRITQGSRTATGGKAEYFRAEERIVMTGSPRVSEGRNSVQGQEIILLLRENRSVVKGGQEGQVRAVFTPQEQPSR